MAIDWDGGVLAPLEAVFGEPATYLPAGAGGYDIVGVFDAAYREVALIDTGVESNSTQPVLGVRVVLFTAFPVQGDQVRIPSVGKLFYVRDVRSDGHGWVKLMLADSGQP